jgi:hypothetical protein
VILMATEEYESSSWQETRERVLSRDDYECRFCGMSDQEHSEENSAGLDVHHVIPRKHGGKDNLGNLVALCRSCHRTLETLHGQAMGEVVRTEDCAQDLAGVNEVWNSRWSEVNQLDSELAEFIKGHPSFADRFGIHESGSGDPVHTESHTLGEPVYGGDYEIASEWDFAVAFGYKEGMFDVVAALDGWTDVPFEGVESPGDTDD